MRGVNVVRGRARSCVQGRARAHESVPDQNVRQNVSPIFAATNTCFYSYTILHSSYTTVRFYDCDQNVQ